MRLQLTQDEMDDWKSQIVISKKEIHNPMQVWKHYKVTKCDLITEAVYEVRNKLK